MWTTLFLLFVSAYIIYYLYQAYYSKERTIEKIFNSLKEFYEIKGDEYWKQHRENRFSSMMLKAAIENRKHVEEIEESFANYLRLKERYKYKSKMEKSMIIRDYYDLFCAYESLRNKIEVAINVDSDQKLDNEIQALWIRTDEIYSKYKMILDPDGKIEKEKLDSEKRNTEDWEISLREKLIESLIAHKQSKDKAKKVAQNIIKQAKVEEPFDYTNHEVAFRRVEYLLKQWEKLGQDEDVISTIPRYLGLAV